MYSCLPAQARKNADNRYFRKIANFLLHIESDLDILPIMPKRSSKRARLPDPNTLAFSIVQSVSGDRPTTKTQLGETVGIDSGKNPAAVALGHLGGLKGGVARAKKLSKKARHNIARKAALARWGTKHGKKGKTAKTET